MQKYLSMNCNIYVLFSLFLPFSANLFGCCIFYGVGGQTISNTIQSTFDMRVSLPISVVPHLPCTYYHHDGNTVLRAHFNTILQLQSQIHQGTSVRERNWLRKNHAGW